MSIIIVLKGTHLLASVQWAIIDQRPIATASSSKKYSESTEPFIYLQKEINRCIRFYHEVPVPYLVSAKSSTWGWLGKSF